MTNIKISQEEFNRYNPNEIVVCSISGSSDMCCYTGTEIMAYVNRDTGLSLDFAQSVAAWLEHLSANRFVIIKVNTSIPFELDCSEWL